MATPKNKVPAKSKSATARAGKTAPKKAAPSAKPKAAAKAKSTAKPKPAAKPAAAKSSPKPAKLPAAEAWALDLCERIRPDAQRRMAELLDRGVERLREGRLVEAIPDFTAVIETAVRRLPPEVAAMTPNVARALYYRAHATQEVSPELALRDIESAVALYDRMPGIAADTVAACRALRGSLLHAMQRLDDAVAELSSAISLLELDKAAGNPVDEGSLNAAYTTRGQAYADLRQLDEAIADSTTAIANFAALEVQNQTFDRAMYAAALRNRGLAFGERRQHGDAIKDLVKAEALIDDLCEDGGTKHLEELAFVCHAQARIWEGLANERNAMENLDKAILKRERLASLGQLSHWRMLAEAYQERGAFHLRTSPVEALADLRRAEEIYAGLGGQDGVDRELAKVREELRQLQVRRES